MSKTIFSNWYAEWRNMRVNFVILTLIARVEMEWIEMKSSSVLSHHLNLLLHKFPLFIIINIVVPLFSYFKFTYKHTTSHFNLGFAVCSLQHCILQSILKSVDFHPRDKFILHYFHFVVSECGDNANSSSVSKTNSF